MPAVGNAVTGLQVGDEVFGVAECSFAYYARGRADKLARKPTSASFEQAATTIATLIAPLGAIVAAFRRLIDGNARGKIAVRLVPRGAVR
jgi:NADPH:quinone reductase-like Zn-dependent oxidoreductase